MSEMTGKKRLQLPEELLEKVSGGYSLDQLTAEEVTRLENLAKAYANAYCDHNEEEIQRIIAMTEAFHNEMIAKYGE